MTDREPTTEEMLATVAAIAMEGRRLIERTNRCLPADMLTTLDTLHEHLAIAGGALLHLAAHMGCEGEVRRMLTERRDRLNVYQAFRGQGGRA